MHIKGQEFAIVIVEGLPKDLNPPELLNESDWGKEKSDPEIRMWRARKSVYVVCSRATAFLYFIYDVNNSESYDARELINLINQVSKSFKDRNESGLTWEFKVNKPRRKRKPNTFVDVEQFVIEESVDEKTGETIDGDTRVKEQNDYTGTNLKEVKISATQTLTVGLLAAQFKVPDKTIQDLLPSEAKAKKSQEYTVLPAHAQSVARKLGIMLIRTVPREKSPINKRERVTYISKKEPTQDSKYSFERLPFVGDFTNKKIRKIVFFGKVHHPNTWKELLMLVSGELFLKHRDEFRKCLSLQGNKRKYFSTNSKELHSPVRINNSNYFVETHENSNSIVRRCRDLMELFRYKEKDLDIYII